jgi:ethanolamine utilization protein EutP (predicted NTPase)
MDAVYDTLAIYEQFMAVDFTEEQSNALVDVFREKVNQIVTRNDITDLATKEDIQMVLKELRKT